MCDGICAVAPVGEVTSITGIAKLVRGGSELNLARSMPVEVRDRLSTAPEAKLTVTFSDGSKLTLSESSSYTVDRYEMATTARRQAEIKLWAGHLRAIVNLEPAEFRTSRCILPMRLVARGTEFETAFIEGRPCPEDRSCIGTRPSEYSMAW